MAWGFGRVLSSRTVAIAAHFALLCCLSHASNVIFSTRLHAGISQHNSPRAIASPSSPNHSPGSFMIQMPFTVVSDPSKLNQHVKNTPIIERTKASGPTLMSLGETGEKINFYTIKCREGVACSSIIPAQVVSQEPTSEKPRSVEEIKRYLKSLNLENGFGFTKPESKPDIAASYFEDDKNDRKSKRVLFRDFRDHEDFWPGSHLRPKEKSYSDREEKRSHHENSFDNHFYRDPVMFSKLTKELPSRVHIIAPVNIFPGRISQGRKFSAQLPSPVFSNALEWPYASVDDFTKFVTSKPKAQVSHSIFVDNGNHGHPQNLKKKHFSNEGEPDGWSRFSTSTVAQLDKKTGDWHKISSSRSKLDKTSTLYKPPVYRPETQNDKKRYPSKEGSISGYDSTYKHTSTGLTVLGVTESNTPTSSVKPAITPPGDDYPSSGSSSTPWSSSTVFSIDPRPANNSQNKQKPLQPISASTHVSYPLYVLPAESSTSLHVDNKTNEANTNVTLPKTTSPTTRRTTQITTRRPVTTTTRPPQSGGGGGGGGGGFLGGNPYAVMAAVGAGLIPATFAALLPVFVGRRRRRRSVDWVDDGGLPAPDFTLSTDLLKFLTHQHSSSIPIVRKR